jgi:hypothetical protein
VSAKFIPLGTDVDPKKVERGYIARSDGLVRWDGAMTKPYTGVTDTGVEIAPGVRAGMAELKRVHAQHEFQNDARAKRTWQERADSMAKRIMTQFQQGGLSPSVFAEVQAEAWKIGVPLSFDQCRELGEKYLARAHKEWEDEQRHKVVRTDTHRDDPGA